MNFSEGFTLWRSLAVRRRQYQLSGADCDSLHAPVGGLFCFRAALGFEHRFTVCRPFDRMPAGLQA
jgi:hypothetical protein